MSERPTDEEEATPHITVPIDGREQDGPIARLYGCHPERPIVRQIGDRPLFLGNRFAADPDGCDRRFDVVLTVAEEREPGTTHFQPLVDGYEAEWDRFRDAADAARRLYRECDAADADCDSLLVHCKAGISRSNTVIATTIACEEDRSLLDAFDLVRAARPHAVAHPRLHELAVVYVAGCGDRQERRP
ncbi:protein-tyrosine phosphatase family protein [Salinarchaeum laminariae]|uniref:protein-tyrosine phosphatase family protein n=1 Tax=Salinarchaeum laminariae TaxID=869888 RepID=UPI0020BFE26A|nr:dual specificity protein phosphatase family protein [Salinarchaeum laminariae]